MYYKNICTSNIFPLHTVKLRSWSSVTYEMWHYGGVIVFYTVNVTVFALFQTWSLFHPVTVLSCLCDRDSCKKDREWGCEWMDSNVGRQKHVTLLRLLRKSNHSNYRTKANCSRVRRIQEEEKCVIWYFPRFILCCLISSSVCKHIEARVNRPPHIEMITAKQLRCSYRCFCLLLTKSKI